MGDRLELHQYRIKYPDLELFYKPLEGVVIDVKRNLTFPLVEKKEFSVMGKLRSNSKIASTDFMPVCLTIYTSHQCNLNCTYCYVSQKETYPQQFISAGAVEHGAQIVAENCKKRNMPFVVGFHGGNEPLLHPDRLEKYLSICEKAATENNVAFLPFCTTNGNIPEDTALWAAKRLYGITLSWDGPPHFHDKYRQDYSKKGSGKKVEETARIFSQQNKGKFLVRCTITNHSVNHLVEIVNYFSDAGIGAVEFYPVFMDKQNSFPHELLPAPETFVFNFLKARKHGFAKDMKMLFSGSRLREFHNRYCMILQDNLTITPDGCLTNCYHCTQNFDGDNSLFFYGSYNETEQRLFVDQDKLEQVFDKYTPELEECKSCFNQFHCSHGCPDLCPFTDEFNIFAKPACIKEKWIGYASLFERVGHKRDFSDEGELVDYFSNISCKQIN